MRKRLNDWQLLTWYSHRTSRFAILIPVFIVLSLALASCSEQNTALAELTDNTPDTVLTPQDSIQPANPTAEATAVVPTEMETSLPATRADTGNQSLAEPSSTESPDQPIKKTEIPTEIPTATATKPADWREMPVIPVVSDNARQIYQRGLQMGNEPHAFSIIGDCQNVPSYFMAVFDGPPQYYRLGEEYAHLQETIDWFSGSYARTSLAVRGGYNGAALLNPLMADQGACENHEGPLACELRYNRPSIAIISLETWWSKKPAEKYEQYLRPVIETVIEQGTVPILATKADNLEGDNSINAKIVELAWEYDIPLWNFWKATQPLPNHGLTEDNFHLTYAKNYFDDSRRMLSGWPMRNLTALQALDAVWRGVTAEENTAP